MQHLTFSDDDYDRPRPPGNLTFHVHTQPSCPFHWVPRQATGTGGDSCPLAPASLQA